MKFLFYSVDAGCDRHSTDEVEISIAGTAVRRAFAASVGGSGSDRLWLGWHSSRLAGHRSVAQYYSQRATGTGCARQVVEHTPSHAVAACRRRATEKDGFRPQPLGGVGVLARPRDARRARNPRALDLQEHRAIGWRSDARRAPHHA